MYSTSSHNARFWHTVGYENGYHTCLSSAASPINALGSLGDISREHLNFCILIRTVCEAGQKAIADLDMPGSRVLGNQFTLR